MTGNEHHLFPQIDRRGTGGDKYAMLVARFQVFQIAALPHRGHAGIDAGSLQSCIHDSPLAGSPAHHSCQHKQSVLEENVVWPAYVLVVISIHEHIGPGLKLVIDARVALKSESASAGARNNIDWNAASLDNLLRPQRQFGGGANCCSSLQWRAQVLCRAVIGMQTGKAERRGGDNQFSEACCFFTRSDAAAMPADVDFDIDINAPRRRLGGDGQSLYLRGMIHQNPNTGGAGNFHQVTYLGCADDLISNEYVVNTGLDKHGGLTDLLAADPDCAKFNLAQCNLWAFMAFCVRAQAHAPSSHRIRHAFEVSLKRIEVKNEGRRVD